MWTELNSHILPVCDPKHPQFGPHLLYMYMYVTPKCLSLQTAMMCRTNRWQIMYSVCLHVQIYMYKVFGKFCTSQDTHTLPHSNVLYHNSVLFLVTWAFQCTCIIYKQDCTIYCTVLATVHHVDIDKLHAHVHVYIMYYNNCLLYTSPSPRDATLSRMPSSA